MSSALIGTDQPEASRTNYRWVMLAGLWLAYCSFGLVQGGIPPLIGPVSDELGLSRTAMGSVLGAWPLIYIGVAIPAGALIDRFGLRRSLAVGVLLVGLSGLLRAVAVNYATLFLAVAVFGLGGPFISVGAPKLISLWFDQRGRGTAMGIYMTAASVGRILALGTANSILMPLFDANWRFTLTTFAGIALVSSVVWWALARDVQAVEKTDEGAHMSLASSLKVFPELLRVRVVQIVLVLSVGSFLFSHGFNNWLPEILREGGMSATSAGFLATLPVVVGILALLLIPHLATPGRRIPLMVGIFLVAGASAAILGFTTGGPLIFGLVLHGATSRGVMPVILLTLMDVPQVGARRMGAAGGLYFTAGEVGGVLGPLVMGVVADLTGDFLGGMLLMVALCVAMASLAVGLGFAVRGQNR